MCVLRTDVLSPSMTDVRFESLTDIFLELFRQVRFTPESGHVRCTRPCLLWANSGHRQPYSITSSATENTAGGTSMPSARAV
jgi:hypothetical protein